MRKKLLSLALALVMCLGLISCGGGAKATTMRLMYTEGTVGVSDDGGKDVAPRENLGLYSGYGVDTSSESYAWINLDDVKLTKMDEDSEITLTKEGKNLEIDVVSGNLFFNVTEPLADDESMNIRTSTMMVGIRGTCGWVTQDTAALLEGTVEVTAGEQSVIITAGEMAYLTENGELVVKSFYQEDIPAFVAEEPLDGDILDEIPAIYPLTVLTRLNVYDNESELIATTDYFYDGEGYILREETQRYDAKTPLLWVTTYSYDGKGYCSHSYFDPYGDSYTIDGIVAIPGSYSTSGFTLKPIGDGDNYIWIWINPMIEFAYDRRSEIGSDGRLDLNNDNDYPEGLYAIYTMDENGYPVYIETYAPDGVLNGTATLEWAVIEQPTSG